MHEVLANRLGGLSLPMKSVVRLTDRPDMTLDVYLGVDVKQQHNNNNNSLLSLKMISLVYFIVAEINILIKFRKAICYTFKINCKSFEKMHGFPINMQ